MQHLKRPSQVMMDAMYDEKRLYKWTFSKAKLNKYDKLQHFRLAICHFKVRFMCKFTLFDVIENQGISPCVDFSLLSQQKFLFIKWKVPK